MSFTEIVWAELSGNDVFQLRVAVGDIIEMRGPLPGGGNLQDEEYALFIEQEASLGRAQARVMLTMQARWAAYAQTLTTKARTEAYRQSDAYARLYAQLIARFGAPSMGAAEDDATGDVVGTPTVPIFSGNVGVEIVNNA